MEIPDDLRYTTDHEWVRQEDHGVRVGITDFAQDALGDVVFIELPTLGREVDAAAPIGEVESTKSVSEVYAPLAGVIREINDALVEAPQRLNADPYGQGWICVIEPKDAAQMNELLDANAYRALTAG